MIGWLALVAAGLVPPANGVRRIEPDVFIEIRQEADAQARKELPPKKLARLRGWVTCARVTPPMRRWADNVLKHESRRRDGARVGVTAQRRFGKTDVLARVEWHRHEGGPWHRGVSLYVRP